MWPIVLPPPVAEPASETTESAEEPQKPAAWKKILLIVAGALGMAAAGLSLIFTLLIGFVSVPDTSQSQNIFYYFFQGFKDTADSFSAMSVGGLVSIPFMTYLTAYLRVGLGAIIAAATIITVLVLAIKTTTHYVAYARGKSEKGIGKLACGTYFAYVAGVVALQALELYSESADGETMAVTLNGATVAGLVLGGICVGCYLLLTAAPRAKALLKKRTLVELICSGVGMILLIVLLALAAGAGASYSGSFFGTSISMSYSFGNVLQSIGFYWFGNSANPDVSQLNLWIDLLLNLAAFVLLGVLVLMVAKEIVSRTRSFEKDTTLSLGRSIGIVILAVVLAVVGIFAIKRSATYFEIDLDAEGFSAGYGTLIGIAVLAVFNLARAITQNVLQNSMSK